MLFLVSLQRVGAAMEIINFEIFRFDPRLQQKIYMSVLTLFLGAVFWFVSESRVDNIVAKKCYLLVLAHIAGQLL